MLSVGNPASVFVVAGRDSKAVAAVTAFLRALGLQVVEWEHAVAKTGLPNPYVGDVVQKGLRMAGAAIILLTPDDMVQLRTDLVRDDDGPDEREMRGQARPNVYYEAGIADALGRERTVIVEIGNVKSFSDAAGRHVVRYDGSAARRHALAERLRVAGLEVNTSGQEWLSVGDVSESLDSAEAALAAGPANGRPVSVDRSSLVSQIDGVLSLYDHLLRKAKYRDLSDLPNESFELTIRAQSLIDKFEPESTYAREVNRVRGEEPHERIPVLMAALRSLLEDES